MPPPRNDPQRRLNSQMCNCPRCSRDQGSPYGKVGIMSVEGIGARVTRKEDKRFITGKGKYT
ncbi:hypothetical protein ABTE48_19440, partial [Acinetobacter baumannii]